MGRHGRQPGSDAISWLLHPPRFTAPRPHWADSLWPPAIPAPWRGCQCPTRSCGSAGCKLHRRPAFNLSCSSRLWLPRPLRFDFPHTPFQRSLCYSSFPIFPARIIHMALICIEHLGGVSPTCARTHKHISVHPNQSLRHMLHPHAI